MAVSLCHQSSNIDRERLRALTGQPAPETPPPPRLPLPEWLRGWIDNDVAPHEQLDSLPGVMWHINDAWQCRSEPNVVLVHYDDLSADLAGEMRRLATLLRITVPDEVWPRLVEAATFTHMRTRADQLTPNTLGVLKDNAAFFRRGTSGSGRELLTDDELAHYRSRTAAIARPKYWPGFTGTTPQPERATPTLVRRGTRGFRRL